MRPSDSRRARATPAIAALLVVVAGCGNDRAAVPDVSTPGPPIGHEVVSYPKAGIRLTAPKGWSIRPGTGTLVATIQTGEATIAIWRYPRTEPLPFTRPALIEARRELIRAARRRDKTFKVGSKRFLRLRGKPAIQLVGRENIGGVRHRVRSTHVFAQGAEVVVDAYAPPKFFPNVDRQVFKPLIRSLRLTKPRATKKKATTKRR